MSTQAIDLATDFNESHQQNLMCCIHQGLLERPIILPAPCLHRLCTNCFAEYLQKYGGQQINCPQCNASHKVSFTWTIDWFDHALNSVIKERTSNQSDINKKIIDYVQHSYTQLGIPSARLKINSIIQLNNPKLKENFEKCKKALDCCEVITLLHGTDRKAAYAIGAQGFAIPTTFERSQKNDAEGELKFGQAIYFAHAKKASEYGKNIFVLTDCIFGRIKCTDESELKLTPEIVHGQGYDTIHFSNANEGFINQEWVIYRSEQCLPLAIIEYELLDKHCVSEQFVINHIVEMSLAHPKYSLLHRAFNGTDNQCKAVLKFFGDAVSKELPQATSVMIQFLCKIDPIDINIFFKRRNETIQILFLRLLWQTGRRTNSLQPIIDLLINWTLLIETLNSSYADVSWRVCGILANMAAQMTHVRHRLIEPQVLNQLMVLLQRAVRFQDKICMVTVLNLLANIAATNYDVMRQKLDILNYLNEHILDHCDEQIQEAGSRLFYNINGKSIITADWQTRNDKDAVTTSSTNQPQHNSTQKICNIFLSIFSKILNR